MARLKTYDDGHVEDFLCHVGRIKHRSPCTVSPSIGFEFEVPLNVEVLLNEGIIEYPEDIHDLGDYYDGPMSGPFSDELGGAGFAYHYECGGLEVCSPVHFNIQQARYTAKALIERVAKERWLDPDNRLRDEEIDCGIHVHAGLHDLEEDEARKVADACMLLLNREDAAEFLWQISGRTDRGGYGRQAVATRWDAEVTEAYDRRTNNGSVQINGQDSAMTCEFRLFDGKSDRLLPAIDLAHSVTKFILGKRHTFKGIPTFTFLYHGLGQGVTGGDVEVNKRVIPMIQEYKEWLMKQPGYANLKADPALAAI